MTVFVADIASFQTGLVPAALVPACAALEVKCTQGDSYVDPDYAGWLPEAAAAGLIPVAYHWIDNSVPAAQAAWLAGHITDPSLAVMLDFEQSTLGNALAVADAMGAIGLRPRLIYLARSYWESLGSPDLAGPLGARGLALINASYPSTAPGSPAGLYPGDGAAQWDAYGGVAPALWQFTDNARLGGQGLDVNAFRGGAAQLITLLGAAAPAGAAFAADPLTGWPTVRSGSTGYWVTVAQQACKLAGAGPGPVDGKFGPATAAALKAAQALLGTADDGVCGPVTWGRFQARTLLVQKALAALGLGAGGEDATAGPATAAEVLAAQKRFGIAQDGLVGPVTSHDLGIPTA